MTGIVENGPLITVMSANTDMLLKALIIYFMVFKIDV